MATANTAQHNRKRQFQPSIHSYFHRHDSAGSDSSSSMPMSPMSPPLPAETQSSLLSVGMRVRKSVPEGYKTHKTMGMPNFPFASTAPPASSAPARPGYNSESSRELAPFCGLHKTGGWSSQPSFPPPSSVPPSFLGQNEQYADMSGLSWSQNSLATTQNSSSTISPASTKKRSREEEDSYERDIEEDLDAFFDGEGEAPTKSTTARLIAQPRMSKQKTVAPVPVTIVDDDFEEASFLAPAEGMDVDEGRL